MNPRVGGPDYWKNKHVLDATSAACNQKISLHFDVYPKSTTKTFGTKEILTFMKTIKVI